MRSYQSQITSRQAEKLRLYGEHGDAKAAALRDFLTRATVAFDWVALTCDADCEAHLGLPNLADARLPVVELPDGERLFDPTADQLAARAWDLAVKQRDERIGDDHD